MINTAALRRFSVPQLCEALVVLNMAEMADADSDMKQQSRDAIISELKFRPGEDLVQYIVSLIDEVNMD